MFWRSFFIFPIHDFTLLQYFVFKFFLYYISFLLQQLICQVYPVKASDYILFLPLCGDSFLDWPLVPDKKHPV